MRPSEADSAPALSGGTVPPPSPLMSHAKYGEARNRMAARFYPVHWFKQFIIETLYPVIISPKPCRRSFRRPATPRANLTGAKSEIEIKSSRTLVQHGLRHCLRPCLRGWVLPGVLPAKTTNQEPETRKWVKGWELTAASCAGHGCSRARGSPPIGTDGHVRPTVRSGRSGTMRTPSKEGSGSMKAGPSTVDGPAGPIRC